uniref:Reverse transcriptase domain-containing protein n=1 Tax=Tanacetum cinerariifolium TaxID=118510 RepID=A0A6L2M246_TANCI|nr:hypothetical protein [Tanacetum cinerariifolium]
MHREDENAKDVQMADHLRPIEELLQIPTEGIEDAILVPGVLMDEFELKIELLDFISNNPFFGVAETLLENEPPNSIKTWVDLVSNSDSSTQIDAITALTKQVEALGYHIAIMLETYNHNQEAVIQQMQNKMGQIAEALQERPSVAKPLLILIILFRIMKRFTLRLLSYDPSIDPSPIIERSDSHHEEFADELAHIISPPKNDHFNFDIEANPGGLTRLLNGNLSSESEFSDTGHLVSFPSGNEDKFFNPEIHIIKEVYSKRSLILPLDVLSPILLGSDLLSLKDSSEIDHLLSFPSKNKDKVFNPRILMVYEFHSFRRKLACRPNKNFKIVKRKILNEISLKIESSICVDPKDKGMQGGSS